MEQGEWSLLLDEVLSTVNIVLLDGKDAISFEKVYRGVYDLVLNNCGEELYLCLGNLLRIHVEDGIRSAVLGLKRCRIITTTELKPIVDTWLKYCDKCSLIEKIFSYLDRAYCTPRALDVVRYLAIRKFEKAIFILGPNIMEYIADKIIETIEIYKKGEVQDMHYVKHAVRMFMDLKVSDGGSYYYSLLEPRLLLSSEKLYENSAIKLLESAAPRYYLQTFKNLRLSEQVFSDNYLTQDTKEKLSRLIIQKMLMDKYEDITIKSKKGLLYDIACHSTENLELLSEIFELSEDGRKFLASFIRDIFVEIFENSIKLHLGLENKTGIADIYNKILSPLREHYACLNIDKSDYSIVWTIYLAELKKLVESLLNKPCLSGKYSNIISLLLDKIVTSNSKSVQYINFTINHIITTEHVKRKEVKLRDSLYKSDELFELLLSFPLELTEFMTQYRRFLAKRLISFRNVHIEQHFVDILNRVKNKISGTLIQSMLNDIYESEALRKKFKCDSVILSPLVVAESMWNLNSYRSHSDIFPPVLKNMLKIFEQYYRSKYKNRLIIWSHTLGKALIRIFLNDTKWVDCYLPTYAMLALLSFDNISLMNSLCFSEIKQKTKLPDKDLNRALTLLTSGSHKIVIKQRNTFSLNLDLKSSYLINLSRGPSFTLCKPQVSDYNKKHVKEQSNIETLNVKVDSTLMRTVKSIESVTHNRLIMETALLLSPQINVPLSTIESRLSSLLEREFISKKTTEGGAITYVL